MSLLNCVILAHFLYAWQIVEGYAQKYFAILCTFIPLKALIKTQGVL